MRQIVLEAPRRFAVREVPTPEPGAGEALLRMRKVGVCGSDMHLFRSGHIGDARMEKPHVIGHECVAEVAAVGTDADEELVGRRVSVEPSMTCGRCRWCRTGLENVCPENRFLGLPPVSGALAEYITHPAHLCVPLPDEIGDEAGVVLEPMAIALHAIRLVKPRAGQRVVILGTGMLGTCVLELLRLRRGLRTVCVDLLPDRLERAERMGADATVCVEEGAREDAASRTLAALGGHGADVVFECAGAADTVWNMCEVAAPAGHVAVVGITEDDRLCFGCGSARRKGLTIRLVRRSLHTLGDCIGLAEDGLIEPEKLVTHTLPASKATEAYELAASEEPGVLKVLVDMEQW
ncbi:MAG: alcohol dehydrogenase catalytic domain-containing protein [Candidatus Brocadiia bacterium]